MKRHKDFLHFAAAYDFEVGKDALYHKIMAASILAGLKKLSPKEERAIIYASDSHWLKLANLIKPIGGVL